MVHIEYQLIAEKKGRVMLQMFMPEQLPKDRLESGIMVEKVPAPEPDLGIPNLYINPETKELWYEYEVFPEMPLYPNTVEGQLQKQVDDLKLLMAELIAGGTL